MTGRGIGPVAEKETASIIELTTEANECPEGKVTFFWG
jgi:hypothetical protein